jgi:hypothetical protein
MVGCFGDVQLSGCIPDFQSALIFSLPIVPLSQRLVAATAVVTFLAKRQNWLSWQMDYAGFLFFMMNTLQLEMEICHKFLWL